MIDLDVVEERTVLSEQIPEAALSETELSQDADLVIAGGISRSVRPEIVIGSTTENILESSNCVVLLLKPD